VRGVDLKEYREVSLRTWERVSTGWSDDRDFLARALGPVGDRLIERLDPEPGQTVLELAAGVGHVGFKAAERLGASGRLISTDFSPAMVERAREYGEERGLDNVDYRVLDAERMDLDDSSVDGVLCRFGYMLMADPGAALAETRRVLREGGRLSFAVWAEPERNPWAAVPGRTMVDLGHLPAPEPGAPGIFSLADPSRIAELVTRAGFGEPEIEEMHVDWGYRDADDHWRRTLELTGPISEVVEGLPPEERERAREAVRERTAPRFATGGPGLPGVALAVLAE
jgi:SAM-dependent methyltransferase